jgi:hypothetical protein
MVFISDVYISYRYLYVAQYFSPQRRDKSLLILRLIWAKYSSSDTGRIYDKNYLILPLGLLSEVILRFRVSLF